MSAVSDGASEGREQSLPSVRCGDEGALVAQGLEVFLGSRRVLSGIDLRVRRGGHVALVGPNGSGKSTLLRALKGGGPPRRGDVWVDGVLVGAFEAAVGLVLANPEDQGVSPVVADDVAFGLENLGVPPAQIRRKVEDVLRRVGLWGVREASVHTLSGGELQRLALASVLALGARYLLLDEATSMLSPWDRDAVFSCLAELRRDGVGLLHVTHQPEEVLWADEVVALDGGRIVFRGPVDGFFDWSGCPWSRPLYLELREGVAAWGAAVPSFGELCSWLGPGGKG